MPNAEPLALSGRRIVVTGASGLVGRALVPLLLRHGAEVVSVFRRKPGWMAAHADTSRHSECRVDLSRSQPPRQVMAGATDVVHMAAVLFGSNEATLYRDNIRITEHVAAAVASAPGVRRVVFTSSLAARGPGDAADYSASTGADCSPVSTYGHAKSACEAIMRSMPSDQVAVAILRAPVVLSRHDERMNALLELVRKFPSHVAPHLPRRFSAIMVDDLADAFVAALSAKPALQGVFDVQHEADVEIGDVLGRTIGRSSAVSRGLADGLSRGASLWASLTGSPPLVTRDKLREARHEIWTGDPTPFRDATGWTAGSSPAEALRRALKTGAAFAKD